VEKFVFYLTVYDPGDKKKKKKEKNKYIFIRLVVYIHPASCIYATTKIVFSTSERRACRAPTPMVSASAIATDLELRTDLSREIRSRRFESQRSNSGTCATPHNIISRARTKQHLSKEKRGASSPTVSHARTARAANAPHTRSTRATATCWTRR
jgi:hypothetical protein